MKVIVHDAESSSLALFAIGLSYGLTSGMTEVDEVLKERLTKVANKLAHIGRGENKFLRQIPVTLDITAPMYWWKEFDTYKVGTTAQSESTMHTILHNPIEQSMFEKPVPEDFLDYLEELRQNKEFSQLINDLPMGWLQRRIVTCNYAVLQNMYDQRHNHKLPEWHLFCDAMLEGVNNPQWIKKPIENEEKKDVDHV